MLKTLSFGASAKNAKLVCLYLRSKYMTAIILELPMIAYITAILLRENVNDRPMDRPQGLLRPVWRSASHDCGWTMSRLLA